MLARNLHKAFAEVEKLTKCLNENEWNTDGLNYYLKWANEKIKEIVQEAISDTIHKLRVYEEEATLWANNETRNLDREHINVNKREQNKSKTQLKCIQQAMATLKEMLEEGID